MSYDGDVMLADCGALHPLTGDACSLPPHDDLGQHRGNGRTWRHRTPDRGQPEWTGKTVDAEPTMNRPAAIPPARRQEFREITPDDPVIVEAFGFALFATGARLNGVNRARAATLWRGAAVEDRAVWLDRAAEVVDAALSYVP